MTAIDTFETYGVSRESPPRHMAAVTPSDGADLAAIASVIFATVAGNVTITTEGGETLTFPLAANVQFIQRITRVHATGTTATGLFVQW